MTNRIMELPVKKKKCMSLYDHGDAGHKTLQLNDVNNVNFRKPSSQITQGTGPPPQL